MSKDYYYYYHAFDNGYGICYNTSMDKTMPRVLNQTRDIIPPNAIYIGRGSKWGNPFIIGKDGDRDEVCEKYAIYAAKTFISKDYEELRGKDLVCFCKPKRCHGDFLLVKANI